MAVKFSQLRVLDDSLATGPINTGNIKKLLCELGADNNQFFDYFYKSLKVTPFKDATVCIKPKFKKYDYINPFYETSYLIKKILPEDYTVTGEGCTYKFKKIEWKVSTICHYDQWKEKFGFGIAYILPHKVEFNYSDDEDNMDLVLTTLAYSEKVEGQFQERTNNLGQIERKVLDRAYTYIVIHEKNIDPKARRCVLLSTQCDIDRNYSDVKLFNNDSNFKEEIAGMPITFIANTNRTLSGKYYGWDGNYVFGENLAPYYLTMNNSFDYEKNLSESQKLAKAKHYTSAFNDYANNVENLRITGVRKLKNFEKNNIKGITSASFDV